jgi:hypothetical protein
MVLFSSREIVSSDFALFSAPSALPVNSGPLNEPIGNVPYKSYCVSPIDFPLLCGNGDRLNKKDIKI